MVDIKQVNANFLYPARLDNDRFNLDYLNNLVEYDADTNDGVSSEASLVYVCPPVFAPSRKDFDLAEFVRCTRLLGGLQSFNISEAQQIIKVKEIGSRLCRDVGGTPQYGLNLSRLLTKHNNLKAAVYQWIKYIKDLSGKTPSITMIGHPAGNDKNNHYVGLESPIFRIPFGILHVKVTSGMEIAAIELAERCHLVAGGTGQTAGSPITMDNWSCTVTRVIPLIDSTGNDAVQSNWVTSDQQGSAFTLF